MQALTSVLLRAGDRSRQGPAARRGADQPSVLGRSHGEDPELCLRLVHERTRRKGEVRARAGFSVPGGCRV
eukprot:2839271-Rhodomonas_salina.2